MASHEETLAALHMASGRCHEIQGGILAQTHEVDSIVQQLLAALGNTEAGTMLHGQAAQATDALGTAMAAMAQLKEGVDATLQRFQG
ncbi:hypothetical protein BJF85_07085 [Saccharomonospora sp. CUA-673]|uniref:hypothetical protein n=1 Tax=Saccharomonospora sp. CUA-673 TaxID=1904969 RepID=UPI000969740C|nr:hypothetical protein [Saccharomonospora sp. CUA-673]OLT38990.1 hypothetical protein BJF85_07085 [Saccharomonospora sp. CUA-673]